MFSEGDPLPSQPGTYVLWFDLIAPLRLSHRRLDPPVLEPGRYVYVGSALGSGGLRARVRRHIEPAPDLAVRRLRWHVDHLTAIVRPSLAWFAVSSSRMECAWTQRLHSAGASWAIRGFGSTDCTAGCQAHLLRLPSSWTMSTIKDLLQ